MTVLLYLDVHIPRAITAGLRLRGVDVLTAQMDGSDRLLDPDLLTRASVLGRVLVTFDSDLLAEAHRRQQDKVPFSGIAYGRPLRISIGSCIRDLEILSKVMTPEDMANRVEYLPL